MKFLQCALYGFFLASPRPLKQRPRPPRRKAPAQSTTPAISPRISTLDGDEVKGPEHPLTLDQMKALYVALGYDKQVAEMNANREKMIAQNKTRNPYMPDAVWQDLDATFSKIDYQAALYDIYKKYLSTEDAAKLIELFQD